MYSKLYFTLYLPPYQLPEVSEKVTIHLENNEQVFPPITGPCYTCTNQVHCYGGGGGGMGFREKLRGGRGTIHFRAHAGLMV